jgi:hypothetical protein
VIIKNVSSRLHILHAEKGAGKEIRLSPGAMCEVSDEIGQKILGSPSGRVGELVSENIPMPKAKGLTLRAMPEDEAIAAIGKCEDSEALDQWAANDDRDGVLKAIMIRKSQILPAVFQKKKRH